MYIKDGIVYKQLNIELDMKEPKYIGKPLYQDIARRLIAHKVIESEPMINEFPGDDKIVSVFVHICNPDNPENLRLANVKKALEGLIDNYPCYSGMRITLN